MRARWRAADLGAILALLALTAVTRIPLAGRTLGEPDGARYALGLEQWLRRGSRAPFIYAKVLSPGYYALAAFWITHSSAQPVQVLELWSWLAALLTAPLLYLLGRRLTSPGVAFAGSVVFLLSPGVWWLGIEPHPQGLSFLCLAAALVFFLAVPNWRGEAAAALLLAAGLLLKNDLILFALVFPALRLCQKSPGQAPWVRALRSLWVPAAASLGFVAGRSALLHIGWSRAQGATTTAVQEFFTVPHGTALLKQFLPVATGPGLATLVLVLTGLVLGLRQRGYGARAWRERWVWPVAAWAAPGLMFWLMIRGNNARHIAPLLLLPLWAALDAWARLAPHPFRRLAEPWPAFAALALILAFNWVFPPPSSNMALFPSGNVPASVADLEARGRDMRAWMRARLGPPAAANGSPPCLIGNPTLPYLEFALESATPQAAATGLGTQAGRENMRIGQADFIEVDNPQQAAVAPALCHAAGARRPRSLEYTRAAVHRRFFGEEWSWLPFARRWYPAAALRLPQAFHH
jgi:hypothetical protein